MRKKIIIRQSKRKVKDLKLEDFMPIKDGLLNFRKRFGFKSADQEAADEFPDTTEKIVEDKEYLANQVFNADKRALF